MVGRGRKDWREGVLVDVDVVGGERGCGDVDAAGSGDRGLCAAAVGEI